MLVCAAEPANVKIRRKKMKDVMTRARAAIGNRWGIPLVAPLANRTRDQPERAKAVAGLVTLPPAKFVDGVGATEKAVDCCCDCACRNGTARTMV